MAETMISGIEFSITADASKAISGIDQLSKALKRLQSVTKNGEIGLANISSELSAFSKSISKLKGIESIQRLSNALKGLSSFASAASKLSADPEALTQFGDSMERIASIDYSNLATAAASIRDIMNATTSGGGRGGMNRIGSDAASAAPKVRRVSNALRSVAASSRRIASSGASAALNALKWSASGVVAPIKSIGNALSGLFGRLKRLIIMRTFRAMIRAVTAAFKEGINNLYAWSNALNGEFARSMDQCSTALTYLKNSLGAMAAPIVNAVAPALDYAIDKIVEFINMINQLIAKLTGASYWTRATRQATSYGGAVEDAMSGAGSAAKEAMRYLAPFDELNVLPDDSKSGGGGGGGSGGGGSSGGGVFEEMVSFNEGIADFAEKIKQAWQNADFTEVGNIVGEKLKTALDNIPWTKIQTTCNKIARSLATFINGAVETPGLWNSVGATIGQAINTAVGAWNTFFDTTHFDSIGEGVSTAINSIFDPSSEGYVDPTEFGRSLTQLLRAAIDVAYGFLVGGENGEGFDFSRFGSWLGESLSSAFTNVPLDKAGAALIRALTGLIDTASAFMETADWSGIASNISGGITSALQTAKNWFQTTDFTKMGSNLVDTVVEFVTGIDWSEVVSSLAGAFGSALSAAFDFQAGITFNIADRIAEWWDEDIKGASFEDTMNNLWEAFKTGLGDVGKWVEENVIQPFIDGFFGEGAWDGIKDAGADIIAGLGDGIADEWRDVKQWVKDHIFTPLIDGIKDAFGINSPAENMKPDGRWIGQGILEGIKEKFSLSSLITWIQTNIFEPFTNALKNIFSENEIKVNPVITVDEDGFGGSTGGSLGGTFKLKGEVDPSFTEVKSEYKSIKDGTATKTISGQKDSAGMFTKISTAFNAIKSNSATKTIYGKRDSTGTFSKISAAFSAIRSNSATKTIYGAAPKSSGFTTAYNAYHSIKSDWATKTIYGSAPKSGGFTTAYTAYHSVVSDGATKTLYGAAPRSGGFTDAYNAYNSLKDKTVTVTINGRSNGVSYGGGWYGYTQAKGGVFSGGAWRDIARYAGGGLAKGSQLFWAREAGPELVGTLGGHTAVINNDQIVASVSAGVARAISGIKFHMTGFGSAPSIPGTDTEDALYNAVMRALNDSNFTFNDDISIEMDGEQIYQGVVTRNTRNTRATGVNRLAMA